VVTCRSNPSRRWAQRPPPDADRGGHSEPPGWRAGPPRIVTRCTPNCLKVNGKVKRLTLIAVLAVVLAANRTSSTDLRAGAPDEPLSLWYRQPAAQWVEALPIGNGRLAAMVFGGVEKERLQLNEDTLWAGGPYDPSHPDALAALPEARRLIFEGKYREANRLIGERMMARPLGQMPYQTAGDLVLTFPGLEPHT